MKKALTKLSAPLLQQQRNRRVMTQFADTMGFVYFGSVRQGSDDFPLIHGLTLSSHHKDAHYTVGSLNGYDVSLVQRTDTLSHPGKTKSTHIWTIVQLDLHTKHDVPHTFIGLHSHSETFYAQLFSKFSKLHRLTLGSFAQYPKEFTDRYAIYGPLAKQHRIERLIDPVIAQAIAKHFSTLTVEMDNDSVYIYSEHRILSAKLLEAMLQNGLWMAQVIDQRIDHI